MAVTKVSRSLDGETRDLEHQSGSIYQGEAVAPAQSFKTTEPRSYYPLQISAENEAGNISREARMLQVTNKSIFPLQLISATPIGEEQGNLDCELDLDIGDTYDFEARMSLDDWTADRCNYGYRLYVTGTEYGGLAEDMHVTTASNEIVWSGYTWRGLLTQKIVEPPAGQDHLILNGELNTVLRQLIGDRFGSLFIVPDIDTGIALNNWQVDRYVTLYDAIVKMLASKSYRLQIEYQKEPGPSYGYVKLQAVPIKDYSDVLMYDQDCNINYDIRDNRKGINHLICVGEGQDQERVVLHLFVQVDGSIGKNRYYTGLAERQAVYSFTSADITQLEKDGTKRLQELQNHKSVDMTIDDVDLEIGDIVGGRDQVTGTVVVKPIVQKILKIQNGRAEIEYKIEGEE